MMKYWQVWDKDRQIRCKEPRFQSRPRMRNRSGGVITILYESNGETPFSLMPWGHGCSSSHLCRDWKSRFLYWGKIPVFSRIFHTRFLLISNLNKILNLFWLYERKSLVKFFTISQSSRGLPPYSSSSHGEYFSTLVKPTTFSDRILPWCCWHRRCSCVWILCNS